MKFFFIAVLSFSISSTVQSHSGRTDSYGCHTKHSTGEYHCHNPKNKRLVKKEGRSPASADSRSSMRKKIKKNLKQQVREKK